MEAGALWRRSAADVRCGHFIMMEDPETFNRLLAKVIEVYRSFQIITAMLTRREWGIFPLYFGWSLTTDVIVVNFG